MPNQRVCDFADPPTEEEGGGNPKKVAQCKRVKFGGRRASPTRQYNSRGVQWGANPAIYLIRPTLCQCKVEWFFEMQIRVFVVRKQFR